MILRRWINQWFAAVFVGIIIIISCILLIFWNGYSNKEDEHTQYVINQVRFHVSEIMTYLETNNLGNYSETELSKLCADNGVQLEVADIRGYSIYNTVADTAGEQVDIKNVVHYDLYTARFNKDRFKIAFPIVDNKNVQVGNAIFTMPSSYVMDRNRMNEQLPIYAIVIIILILIVIMLYLLKKRIFNHLLLPIQTLKYHSEAILKGDYTQKAEYINSDEIGEVYDIFDQMRMEIMTLSMNRDNRDKVQKELITNISHDLRTPITSIKAYVEAMKAGVCKDEASLMEYMDIMQTNIDKMAWLVEDLLLHALKELGQISVKPLDLYSQEMLQNIIKPIAYHVRNAGIKFIEPLNISNVLINVDEHRIEQVISNLVSNALKHTNPGGTIEIKSEVSTNYLKITISDTGEGILPQDMPFIFNRYFQGQTSSDLKAGKEGSGLGLSICKHIIEAHNGQISFRSKKGEGTIFYFTIPLI